MTIAVVDYGAGNLTSVKNALEHLGVEAIVTSDPETVLNAGKIILPGVGHFSATAALDHTGLRTAILQKIDKDTPFLGICVGMQWMFASSVEAPDTPGLGIFAATCQPFPAHVKSPHVGWNSLTCSAGSQLLRGIPSGSFVYFTHSYWAPVAAETVACCEYAGQFSAAVERGNVFGVQFHPEKSGATGLKLLRNFCDLPC